MRKEFLLLYLLAFFSINTFAQPIGYNFGKQIAIPSSSVSGSVDLSNFPLLISITDSDLRTVANSGNVTNANGFDIVFTQSDCSTLLDHQIEKYDPVTGEYVVWVRVPILSASRRTDIHMYYGNSSISVDPSTTSTFNSNYEGCWHMNNDPSNSLLIDYSGNGVDGTSFGTMTTSDLISGKIGNAIDFDGTNDYFALTNKSYVGMDSIANLTISAWIKTSFVATGAFNNWSILDFDRSEYYNFFIHGDGRLGFATSSNTGGTSDSYAGSVGDLNDNSWHFVTAVYNGSNKLLYIDGNLSLTETNPHSGDELGRNTTRFAFIGEGSEASSFNGNRNNIYYQGQYDEIRFSEVALTSDWIKTEYDNQNNPSTFYSIGSEETASDLCAIALDVELNYFEVECLESEVLLKWQTLSETNNNYFTIERSLDAQNWEYLTEVKGAGNSINPIQYKVIDKSPKAGLFYYKLTQTDFDGVTSEDILRTVNCEKIENSPLKLYPNPSTNYLIIESQNQPVKIYTISGKEITSIIPQLLDSNSKVVLSTENLSKGFYIIKTNEGQAKFIKN